MAGVSTPNARQQVGKQMSSRLLNMKFMQRSAASTPNQTPSTEPASKRRKLDSATSSPSASVPGTPFPESRAAQQSVPQILRRVGTNTFDRGDGADTEWVLDLDLKIPVKPKSQQNSGGSANGSGRSGIPGLGSIDNDPSASEEEEEDIWRNQLPGRQTYGSFKRKNIPQKTDADNDEDLSSASGSDDDSDSDSSSSSTHRRPKRNKQKRAKEIDSDEEMRQVRRAMEQKHDRMAGTGGSGGMRQKASMSDMRRPGGHGRGEGTTNRGGADGSKRRRDEPNYSSLKHKKARMTI